MTSISTKSTFAKALKSFAAGLNQYLCTPDGQWSVRGFIDAYRHIYSISSDTKVVSKILEIHLFPKIRDFAKGMGFELVLPDRQNYYPDLSFVKRANNRNIRFAVDLKSTFRRLHKGVVKAGFTLGSHGEYFCERSSNKNIQFPYSSYSGHFCLCIVYDKVADEKTSSCLEYGEVAPETVLSPIRNLSVFAAEKWKIASDKQGSGNTANIGSVDTLNDLVCERGVFVRRGLSEKIFDEYWMNYGKVSALDSNGEERKITSLDAFLKFRGIKTHQNDGE